jgi:hypothetical protein
MPALSKSGGDRPQETIFRDIASFRTALWIFQHAGCYLFDAILDLTTVRAAPRLVGVDDVVISISGSADHAVTLPQGSIRHI